MEKTEYSYCETAAATGMWHIRRLSDKGRRPGGGADTPTLCGMIAAWDVPSSDVPFQYRPPDANGAPGHTCPACSDVYTGALTIGGDDPKHRVKILCDRLASRITRHDGILGVTINKRFYQGRKTADHQLRFVINIASRCEELANALHPPNVPNALKEVDINYSAGTTVYRCAAVVVPGTLSTDIIPSGRDHLSMAIVIYKATEVSKSLQRIIRRSIQWWKKKCP